jgi:hypothetical protein
LVLAGWGGGGDRDRDRAPQPSGPRLTAGVARELWHLPRENVTIAVTWNDDLIGSESGFFPHCCRLRSGRNEQALSNERNREGVRLSV